MPPGCLMSRAPLARTGRDSFEAAKLSWRTGQRVVEDFGHEESATGLGWHCRWGQRRGALVMALAGCASSKETKSEPNKPATPAAAARARLDLKAPVAESSVQLPRFRIGDWSPLPRPPVVVIADDGTRYRAETMGPCIGLNTLRIRWRL